MAAKKKKTKKSSEWNRRLAGFALCAFFALGMLAGLSGSGHLLAQRAQTLLDAIVPRPGNPAPIAAHDGPQGSSAPVALVRRADGFYTLDASGRMVGPVAPATQGDLPILSGAVAASASGAQLVDYASIMIRAEVALAMRVSEMAVEREGEATLYLDRPPLQIFIDFEQTADELARAAKVLSIWRGHRDLLVAIDATVPGQAIARVRPAAFRPIRRASAKARRSAPAIYAGRSDSALEVTASR